MNSLIARCTGSDDGGVADTATVHYSFMEAGPAADISLNAWPLPNGHLLVVAKLVDRDGNMVFSADDRMYFDRAGGGVFTGDEGTPTGSRVIEAANGRAEIELTPPHGDEKPAIITVRTQNLNGTTIRIPAVKD